MDLRVGQGIDRHRLVMGRTLVVGGVEIEHTHGLAGHSDADCLLHAICDAMLGAAALGDIGQMFSDLDDANRNRSSLEFLAEVEQRIGDAGFAVLNVDATVMIEYPRLAPHLDLMRENIASILGIGIDRVSVKATRGERVGPEGRAEAATAHAVVLLARAGSL
jgi:2-C-methyl-D-erythritol 2,4-cyclodiphosphate synthase